MTGRYLRNRWIKIGLAIGVLGCGPLLAIILLASIGLWPDPDPNPIGPGLLFFFSFWPMLICLAIGLIQARRSPSADETAAAATAADRPWFDHPFVKTSALLGGIALALWGVAGLGRGEGRGAAAAIVLGVVVVYWVFAGRLPFWFRR